MKKTFITILLLAVGLTVFSQNDSIMRNKNGYPILPEQGDIAIGLTMTPIFTYLGNFFHGNNTSAPPAAIFRGNSNYPTSVIVKYFTSSSSAFRFTFDMTATTTTESHYVQDDEAINIDPLSNAQVTDIMFTMNRNYVLGFGYEKRRGNTRLQGVYGAELLAGYGNNMTKYLYGNPMSADNPMPTTFNFGNNYYNTGRVTQSYAGEQLSLGANAFLGFEYFILPKISLGAEFAYGVFLTKQRQAKVDYEYWNVDHIEAVQAIDPGDVQRMLTTTNPSANFFLMLHF